jgi:hypothetical protein
MKGFFSKLNEAVGKVILQKNMLPNVCFIVVLWHEMRVNFCMKGFFSKLNEAVE